MHTTTADIIVLGNGGAGLRAAIAAAELNPGLKIALGVFKEEESITMWITDDKNKIPVKLKTSLRVGSLIAELDGFNSLKHETNLKK